MLGATASLQPRLLSSFVGDRFIQSAQPLYPIFRYKPRSKHVSMQLSRTFSALTDFMFNKRRGTFDVFAIEISRSLDEVQNKRKRLVPGELSPRRPVPDHIQKPPYVNSRKPPGIASGHEVHDEKGIECMRASGKLAAQVLEFAGTLVKPGIKTDEIDQAVHQMIIDNGAYPSPLGYGGFPKSVCTSVNECICHGIPDSRPLEDGDIINIDVTVYLNGYHGDTSATFFCGDVDDDAKTLVQVTKECLYKAISICAPGVPYNRIGKTIHDHADKYQYGVVRQYVGHGVGRVFHADPVIVHHSTTLSIEISLCCLFFCSSISSEAVAGERLKIIKATAFLFSGNNDVGRMMLNQTFTIEPMLTIGSRQPVMWDDNWTVVTEDGSLSAQFEHTILITEDGAEILTQC
ncbi:Methionine aminopeptidase 1D, chloroplastic/mitochondrial [Turnera subulata]|uniref:Methionine aminopeptidase n=1 Tax=Turnera subulata TaxID=218843 RepID=A0A9Q0JM69_9ROSI|nr:Methionine aminopeptidase 1D, chloroplastic/mitochondrial [Turnera subulata]